MRERLTDAVRAARRDAGKATPPTTPVASQVSAPTDAIAASILDIDVLGEMPGLDQRDERGRTRQAAWLVLRHHSLPVGLLTVDLTAGPISAERVHELVSGHLDAHPGDLAPELWWSPDHTAAAVSPPNPDTPTVAVVLCTRRHPDALRVALRSLCEQTWRRFVTVVVDNDPAGNETREVVGEFEHHLELEYVLEPRAGLSRARNAALRAVDAEIVAWLDDDEIADPRWLEQLLGPFRRGSVAAVSGSVVPASLDTETEMWFEDFGGHVKGRGFTPRLFPSDLGGQSPLFPVPPFGVGANMAFRTSALRELGGFDPRLGAGTRTGGGEDTKVFTQLLLAGMESVYWPAAMTRHYHRDSLDALRHQLRSYGAGHTAFYTALLIERPRLLAQLVMLVPRALRQVLAPRRRRIAKPTSTFPPGVLRHNKIGLATGPALFAYEAYRSRKTS